MGDVQRRVPSLFLLACLLACLGFGATGCAEKLQAKTVQAASADFPCDPDQVQLETDAEGAMNARYLAHGCGWEADYEAKCGMFGCGAATSGRLDAGAAQYNRNARLGQLKHECDKEFKETSCQAYEREMANPAAEATGTGHAVPGVRPSTR